MGVWYDWKPPKMALEALFAWGDLMVADRVNFQRVYDVRERVLPEWVDTTPVDPDEARRFCLEQAAKALGVFEPRHLTLYAYMRATPARSIVRALIEEGVLVEIQGESMNGVKTWMVHRDNLPLLQRAADGDLKAERTTFLAPFDSLFWAWERDRKAVGLQTVAGVLQAGCGACLWLLLLPDPAQGSAGGSLRSEAGSQSRCAASECPLP